MTRETMFKIIELPTHQLLLTRDFDEEKDDVPTVSFTVFVDEIKIKQSLSFASDEARDKAFSEITDAQAQDMLDGILFLMRHPTP